VSHLLFIGSTAHAQSAEDSFEHEQLFSPVLFQPLFKNVGEKQVIQKGDFSATFSSKFKDSTSGFYALSHPVTTAYTVYKSTYPAKAELYSGRS
jgi:hypothetical protein